MLHPNDLMGTEPSFLVTPVGSDKAESFDVRVIAATNVNAGELRDPERFRPDPHADEPGSRVFLSRRAARWSPRGGVEVVPAAVLKTSRKGN